jgi:multiple sugar transport system ATP-binding protein
LVEIKKIVKNFGKTKVLQGISLDIKEGEFISLVGPSGCGKSTLLKLLAGLESPTEGDIYINGDRANDKLPRERNIAMVFQSYALYPHLTVKENIMVPLILERLKSWQRLPVFRFFFTRRIQKELNTKVKTTAAQLHIEPLLHRKPGQLSGGQKQRVALGRAMVRNPKIFLMDEPLSNLDAKLRVVMRAEIVQLHRRLGTTFIYVTHDQAEAMTMSDRIAIMMDGQILQLGTPKEVYKDPVHLKVAEFIGSPKINVISGFIDSDGVVKILGEKFSLKTQLPEGSLVKVGFRPESVKLNQENGWNSEVIHTEYLGSELMLFLKLEKQEKTIIVRSDNFEIDEIPLGSFIKFLPQKNKTLLFNDQGNRVSCEWITDKNLQTAGKAL